MRDPLLDAAAAEDAALRALLLDAAELLLSQQGYAAVTPRRLAARAGVRPQAVTECFETMDALFIALHRRRCERRLQAAERALQSDRPLQALWARDSDPTSTAIEAELMALANHRPAVRAEMARAGDQLRALEQTALTGHFRARGIEPPIPPIAVCLLILGVGQALARDAGSGASAAHEATTAFVEKCLARLEAPGAAPPARAAKAVRSA